MFLTFSFTAPKSVISVKFPAFKIFLSLFKYITSIELLNADFTVVWNQ